MATIDSTDHPGDYIDRAQCMLAFLNLMISENRGQLDMPERSQEGLCYILTHIEQNLNQAAHLL